MGVPEPLSSRRHNFPRFQEAALLHPNSVWTKEVRGQAALPSARKRNEDLQNLEARQKQRSQEESLSNLGPRAEGASKANESTINAGSQVPYRRRAGHRGKLKVEDGQVNQFPRNERPQHRAARWG